MAASMITQAGLRPSAVEPLDPALHGAGVVERHGDGQLDDGACGMPAP